eukprot:TRINITY_DN2760_c0_g1_i1.p1 TRINITY_DN2760_c0_g1~~TRINITY_DN2760_c0_g1_i1.p1  ORF type:complete len:176 (+),score=10.31 TRINITY_DN2760_c0_g1_i1:29-529(+)
MFNTRIALFLLVLCCPSILGYKPVIMMHGFSFDENHGTYHDYDNIIQWISEVHPGQKTVSLDIFNGEESMTALWKQLPKIIELVRNVTSSSEFDDGYHIIGHSQGGLLTRCVAESMPEHKIENLISMALLQLISGFRILLLKPLRSCYIPLLCKIHLVPLIFGIIL